MWPISVTAGPIPRPPACPAGYAVVIYRCGGEVLPVLVPAYQQDRGVKPRRGRPAAPGRTAADQARAARVRLAARVAAGDPLTAVAYWMGDLDGCPESPRLVAGWDRAAGGWGPWADGMAELSPALPRGPAVFRSVGRRHGDDRH